MIKLKSILTEELAQTEFVPVKLDWKFKDYEPAFDAETMKLHYDKHYKGYIDKLNKAIKEENIPVMFNQGQMTAAKVMLSGVTQYSNSVRNNGGGFYNHTIWFNQLNPDDKGKIEEGSDIDVMIKEQFGTSNFGSGWTWLLYDKGQLRIVNTANQDNPYMDVVNEPGQILMGIDLWEHAYYLKYKNDRAKYVDAFFKLLCWKSVGKRLDRTTNI